jgi:hypothetical protein
MAEGKVKRTATSRDDGNVVLDAIFGNHGFYNILVHDGAGPGGEFTLEFIPHSPELLRKMETPSPEVPG